MTGAVGSRRPRVILSGGGTAGHVAPALAVAAEITVLRPDAEMLYVGTDGGLESELVPRAGLPFAAIRVNALSGRRSLEALRSGARAGAAVMAAATLIGRFAPDVALGTGGYVAGPVLAAAWLRRVPTAIHEQNLRPGITNGWLARVVREIYVSFEESRAHFSRPSRVVHTGYPVRPEILRANRQEGAAALGLDAGRPTLLVVGGSLGARTINEAVKAGLAPLLGTVPGLQVVVATGAAYYEDVVAALARTGIHTAGRSGPVIVEPYIHDMHYAYAAADLVLCRAGGSIHELTARGLASVLVPSPNVAYDQQTGNAQVLAEAGAAVLMPDETLTGATFATQLAALWSEPGRISDMGSRAAGLGRPLAGRDIARRLLNLGGFTVLDG